jgi:hypothetical protein
MKGKKNKELQNFYSKRQRNETPDKKKYLNRHKYLVIKFSHTHINLHII